MRKKLQDKMFELSYLFELFVSLIVGLAIFVFAIKMIVDTLNLSFFAKEADSLMGILDGAITLAIGAELIKMLCTHTPETIIDVLAFALARHLIVEHKNPLENLTTVLAIAILFAVRKFFLQKHDLLETPDGLIEVEGNDEKI